MLVELISPGQPRDKSHGDLEKLHDACLRRPVFSSASATAATPGSPIDSAAVFVTRELVQAVEFGSASGGSPHR
jgi:hypothetical protein